MACLPLRKYPSGCFLPENATERSSSYAPAANRNTVEGLLGQGPYAWSQTLGGKRLNDLSAKLKTITLCLGNLSHYLIASDLKCPALKMALGVILVRLAAQNQIVSCKTPSSIRSIGKKGQYVGVKGAVATP